MTQAITLNLLALDESQIELIHEALVENVNYTNDEDNALALQQLEKHMTEIGLLDDLEEE